MTGAILSIRVIIWVQTLLLPQASLTVKVLLIISGSEAQPEPLLLISSTSMTISSTIAQLSVTEIKLVFPGVKSSIHEIVSTEGQFKIIGTSSSTTFSICAQVEVFPQTSLTT